MSQGTHTETATYNEITNQSKAWQEALQVVENKSRELIDLWSGGDYAQVVFTGCGSTHYLSLAAAALFQELTGCPARGVPAGELSMYPAAAYVEGKKLLVAVSRSAETTETVQAATAFRREREGEVVVVTNYPDLPLTELGTITIAIPAGQEESIAQTRSFASMYVATAAMAATLAGRTDLVEAMQRLPEVGDRLLAEYGDLAHALGSDLARDRFYFLGSGPRYGLACEMNLKMKEMTLTHSEPFHLLEFRHGPKSMVGTSTVIVGMLSDGNRAYEAAVLDEMGPLGARVLSLGEADAEVAFRSGVPEAVRNVLYLPVLQLMAYHRAMAKGLNPDEPTNLDAVVKLAWGS